MRSLRNPADKQQLLRRIKALRPTAQRRWGRMTAPQMVAHLNDAYKAYMGLIELTPLHRPVPAALAQFAGIWSGLPWPRGVKTAREVDQEIDGTPPGDFAQDVAELRALIDRYTRSPRDFEWPSHPFFGRMTERSWLRLGYLHADHHLRQFGA